MTLSVLIPWDPRTTCPWRIRSFGWLLRRYNHLFPDAQICIGKDESEPFNRSRARNNARAMATGDFFLIADADTLFNKEQIEVAMAACGQHAEWMIPYGPYYNLDVGITDHLLGQDPSQDTRMWCLPPDTYEHKIEDSPAGLIVMPRRIFDAVGGYDERFIGWGYEDNAFRTALETRVGGYGRMPSHDCYHLWHPIAEGGGFDSPTINVNRRLFRRYERARSNPAAMKKLTEESIHHRMDASS